MSPPPYHLYPLTLPQPIADRLLAGIEPQPCNETGLFLEFWEGNLRFANVPVPNGMVLSLDMDARRITLLVGGKTDRIMKQFLHRMRSGKAPCHNELTVSPTAAKSNREIVEALQTGYVVSVLGHRAERFVEGSKRQHVTAVLIEFELVEALPTRPAVSEQAEEEGEWEGEGWEGWWKELDVIVEQCKWLRAENRRGAEQAKHDVPDDMDPAAWRGAVAQVLDYCNKGRLPKAFAVAWEFVASNKILQTYVRRRGHEGDGSDPASARKHVRSLVEVLGPPAIMITNAAMVGWERGAAHQKEKTELPAPSASTNLSSTEAT